MGLNSLSHDSWLLYGVITNPSSHYSISDIQSQLHIGLYVNNLVFYSSDPSQENLFKTLLQEHIQVNFMGNVDYFLGTAFTWLQHTDGNISVHICQSEFTEFTAHRFSVHSYDKVPNMTPYCSGFPIDSIPPVDPLDLDLPRQKHFYHSIVVCINWLATCNRPDISPAITFLTSYSNYPHTQHYKAAVHALKYLTSTNEYGI